MSLGRDASVRARDGLGQPFALPPLRPYPEAAEAALGPLSDGGWNEAALQERRRICVHESSHAVAALACEHEASVKLTITRDADGRYGFRGVTSERCRGPAALSDRAFISAAGVVGEMRFCAENDWPLPSATTYAEDRAAIDEAAEKIAPGNASACVAAILGRAIRALAKPDIWQAVLNLADALSFYWPDEQAEAGEGAGEFNGEMPFEVIQSVVRAGLMGNERCAT